MHSCKRAYLHRANTHDQVRDLKSTSHQRSFSLLKKYIDDQIIAKEGAELLASLHQRYLTNLDESTSIYDARSLKDKILREYPAQIKTHKLSNKEGTIIYNAKISQDAAVMKINTSHNTLLETAYHLRSLIKEMEHNQEPLPQKLTAEFLNKGQAEPPEDLVTFFKVLFTGKTGDVKNDKITRLISSICDDTEYATSRGRIKPGKHLTMGLGMKSITGARKVIDILNRMGHCICYHTVEEIETSLATDISSRQSSTPDGIVQQPGLVTSLAWDNYDENIETLSGCDTVHDTVGICYQNIPSGIQDNILTDTPSTTQETEHLSVEVTKTKRSSRAFVSEPQPLEPYRKKPKMTKFQYHAPSI